MGMGWIWTTIIHRPAPPGDSWSPVHAHGELGCRSLRRLRNRNAEFAMDSRRCERRWIHIRGIRGNAEAGVKSAFRISHPIRHEPRSTKQEQQIKKYIQAQRRTANPSMRSPLRSLCSFVVKSPVVVNGYVFVLKKDLGTDRNLTKSRIGM